jgi:hypothetical protein
MANVKHGVIRTDRMYGTDVGANLVSVKYMGAGTTEAAIDNGCVVALDGLMAGQREIYKGITPAANTALGKIALIATPEVMYDERKKNLEDYENEAGVTCRGYILHSNDIFSVTAEALDAAAAIAVGNIVEVQAGVKLKVVASATSGSTAVGKVIAIEKAGRYTYYVIQVD